MKQYLGYILLDSEIEAHEKCKRIFLPARFNKYEFHQLSSMRHFIYSKERIIHTFLFLLTILHLELQNRRVCRFMQVGAGPTTIYLYADRIQFVASFSFAFVWRWSALKEATNVWKFA